MKKILPCILFGVILALLGCSPPQTPVQITATRTVVIPQTEMTSPTTATETPLPPTFTPLPATLESSQTPVFATATQAPETLETSMATPSPTITQVVESTASPSVQSVTDYPAFLWSPFPPPDGPGLLEANLYSALPISPTEWQLESSVTGMYGSPSMVVSPDRTQIILLTLVDSNENGEYQSNDISKIYLYTPANGSSGNLIDNESSVYKLNWLPDSQTFIYAQGTELYSGNIDGSTPQLLANFPDVIASLATSPDGSLTAIGRFPGNLDFWDSETGAVSSVASETTSDLRMAWSPDSHWLAFNKSIAYGLYLVDSNTLETLEVMAPTFDIAYYLGKPVWSPDSQRLAFTQSASTLYLWDASTRTLSEIARATHVSEPAWSLDSQQLAFVQDNAALYLWDVNTQTSREIARATYMGLPAWSPDGTKFAIGFSGNDRSGIVLFDNTGETIQEISKEGSLEVMRTLKWSPDGNWLAFFATWNGQTGLFVADINNNDIHMVLDTTGTIEASDPVWLPTSVSKP